jgi:hypothetical protein
MYPSETFVPRIRKWLFLFEISHLIQERMNQTNGESLSGIADWDGR